MSSQAEKVLTYYVVCNRLKNIIRTGWKNWNVKKERLESVAEHVYGVQMLAIAMHSEYQYDIDLKKVLYMLAIHELGETIIGDITQFQMESEDKRTIELEAVRIISKSLMGKDDSNEIEKLFIEFEARSTKEALFAYQCDKLEADLQCRIYDEANSVDLTKQSNNISLQNEKIKKLLDDGASWSEMWLKFGQSTYPYDSNFLEVSNYAMENSITSKK